ncbi:MAG TPA: alpha/beta hydrolase [Pontiellaceae bacterium]|nr:alpha/beta hydrolase [Pontiellaceae bacterium]
MEKRMILRPVLLVIILYLCAVLWMWLRQERYLFLPKHYDPQPEFERFRWDREISGIRHQGWFLDKGSATTVIYHGGNAEDLAGHCQVMWDGLDANALLVNYRGYGQSEGAPGEKEMVADAIAIFDLFCAEKKIAPSNIFLMGRSLGSGVAIQVAAARPQAAGLILVTPYESIEAMARFRYPWLPAKGIMRHPFHAIKFAPEIKMPALVLLAEFDEVIPVETGRKLGEALGGPKKIITLPMGHMDINEHPGYYGAINRFINPPGLRPELQ